MKRAEVINRDEYFNININKYQFHHEHKLDSYGKIDGKIVIVDYG